MKKIALHWQILIALVLGALLGFFLAPNYQVTENSLEKIEKQIISDGDAKKISSDSLKILKKEFANTSKKIEGLKGNTYKNTHELNESLEKTIGKEAFEKYGKTIQKSTKFEPVKYISWIGDIFLRALKMIIVPLILSSIISGITGIGGNLGRLGGKTFLYYLSTSLFAITTGLIFVNILQPGVGAPKISGEVEGLEAATESFGSTLINMIPTNIFQSLSSGDMLSIIFFAIIFGYFISKVETKYSELLTNLFNAVFEVMMKITMFIILFTPIGVLGLVADVVAEQAGDSEALAAMAGSLGWYMLTVILALGFHFLITLPLLVMLIGRSKPFKHLKAMTNPLLTAFSTSSSSATLPLTMETIENKSGVSNRVTSFTLPLGATINMDGTALYECVAAMFIAQAYGIDLGLGEQIIVVFTALLASIGAAGIPMAGLVMISVILSAVGLPLEGVGMILAVDRILDMLRTMTNVWSDSCGAVIIAKSEGEELKIDS